MPKPKKGPRLGSGPAHQKLILSGLASSLIRDGRVKTTEARAKAVRPVAERMITHAKKGDIAARRLVLRTIRDKDIVHHLFAEVAPRFAARNGGYTRITKVGFRKGDAAPMAIIELVELSEDEAVRTKSRKRAADETEAGDEDEDQPKRRRLRRKKGEPAAGESRASAAAADDDADEDGDADGDADDDDSTSGDDTSGDDGSETEKP